jgi:hypothetical protein
MKRIEALERYPVLLREGYYALRSPSGKDFAVIDTKTTRALKAVQSLGNLRLQAVVQCNATDRPGMAPGTVIERNTIKASINLYGAQILAKKVGTSLTQERQFLQHPDMIDDGVCYDNPHYFKTPGQTANLEQCTKSCHDGRTSKAVIFSEVGKIMDSLSAVDSDICIPATDVLLTSLLR